MGINPQLRREISQGRLDSGNALKTIVGANPTAGAEVLFTVPAGKYWALQSLSVPLVQGLTNTPQPLLVIDDGTNVVFESLGSSAPQAVSTTCQYTWAPNLPLTGQIGTAAAVHSTAPIPPELVIPPTWRVRTVTLGIAATGDYGVPFLFVAEYTAG